MAEYKLNYTASKIDEKLGKVGEPVSWNDLTDKPFGEEVVAVPFVPEQTVSDFEYIEELNVSVNGSIELTGVTDSSIFRDGSTVNVVWDGVLYENLDIKYFEDVAVYYIGGDFNGETFDLSTYPFIIMLIDYDFAIYSNDTTATSHTLSISINQKTLTPIDTKYLPEHLQFGEETGYGDTLYYSGNPDDYEMVSFSMPESGTPNMTFVRLSETIPSDTELANGITVVSDDYISTSATYEEIQAMLSEVGIVWVGMCLIIPTAGYVLQDMVTFPTAGIWVIVADGEPSPASVTVPGFGKFQTTVIKQLDSKFIPGSNIFWVFPRHSSEDFYLYMDREHTTKATKRDVVNAVMNGRTIYMFEIGREDTNVISNIQDIWIADGATMVGTKYSADTYCTAEFDSIPK